MTKASRLKQFLVIMLVAWLALGLVSIWLFYNQVEVWKLVTILSLLVVSVGASLATLNQSQIELAETNKAHSATKRQVQEARLKIDRYEYDSKKSGELRRIVLNSTQEKDHALQNMANALDHAMDELIEISHQSSDDLNQQVEFRAKGMKQYAFDLKSLAKLELKSEIPQLHEMNFIEQIGPLVDDWNAFGKGHKVSVKLDNPEDHMPIMADELWLENLLSRVARALIRMNHDTKLTVHLIGYLDADIGDALRITFAIDGRVLSEEQLKRVLTEYVAILENGQDVGPGLTFVVARRMAQLLNGQLDINASDQGTEVLIIIPRNPFEQNYE
ncbi:ATP-binding protein [Reinekea marina]|uniref:Sensor histidine kinase n=1 Tax=Reinekea marina TaxID=1310421 RepID=A0ABV7WMY2_9GAMM|nr:ATP-binding protein [Reinekea marina]MDN3648664.1 ATP-binding protein [Reinekea marina]